MNTTEVLKQAQELIRNPEDWCQGELARDNRNIYIDINADGACRFCSEGALRVVHGKDDFLGTVSWDLINEAAVFLGQKNAIMLNDKTDHATVMKMFDKAIELSEA
jgi:hypothetical protein